MKKLGLIIALALAGCANQSPLQKAYADQTLYNSSLTTLITLRKAGVLSDTDYKNVETIRAKLDLAISAETKDALAGNSTSASTSATDELDQLITVILKGKGK